MARKKLIAANWKMYKTPDQAREFFRDFLPLVQGHDRDEIVVCPTFLAIDAGVKATSGTNTAVGAQDVHWEKEGAFTGEINASMLVAVGCTHAIIRGEAAKAFGQELAASLRILYGGSVKPENAKALMSEEEIDGALVGGASLDPKSLAAIVKY